MSSETLKYKDKLTVLIPVHGRQYYLPRVCEYYKDFVENFGTQLLIVDSSDNKWGAANNYPYANYVFYGPEANSFKFLDSIKGVNTEFLLLGADDDFFIKRSLLECLDFLMENPGYSSCHGEFLRFDSILGEIIYSDYSKLHCYRYLTNNYYYETASERLINFFDVRNFLMLNHSVTRTQVVRDIYQIRSSPENKHLNVYRCSDQQFTTFHLLAGNLKVLPCVYALRDSDRLINKGLVPKDKQPHIGFEQFPDLLRKHGNPYIKLLAQKDEISTEEASFVLGLAYQKLITGREFRHLTPSYKAENFKLPSQTKKYRKDIKEALNLTKKYRCLIPNFNNKKLLWHQLTYPKQFLRVSRRKAINQILKQFHKVGMNPHGK